MPASMVHLLAAHRMEPAAALSFYIGSLAPDAIRGWAEKDRGHFRDVGAAERAAALLALAAQTDPADGYAEGILLHLYLDSLWDAGPMHRFREERGADWFLPYRAEISLTSGWLYHHLDWAPPLWRAMAAAGAVDPRPAAGASPEEIAAFLTRNAIWHHDNDTAPSAVYPPEMVDEFVERSLGAYRVWREQAARV